MDENPTLFLVGHSYQRPLRHEGSEPVPGDGCSQRGTVQSPLVNQSETLPYNGCLALVKPTNRAPESTEF